MTRILIDDEWYERVSSGSYYESEYEAMIRSRSDSLFPEFWAVDFKLTVQSREG